MREKMGTTSINHDIKSSNLINTQIIAVTEEKEMGNQKERKESGHLEREMGRGN